VVYQATVHARDELTLAYVKPNLKPDGTITPNHSETNSFQMQQNWLNTFGNAKTEDLHLKSNGKYCGTLYHISSNQNMSIMLGGKI